MITVGLLWHSVNSDNFGVGALTLSQMAIIDSAAKSQGLEIRYYIFSGGGGSQDYGNQSSIVGRCSIRKNFFIPGKSEFIPLLKKCDLILDIGEGDSFTDIYGIKRLIYMLGTKAIVRIYQKPLILSPQTIGPFEGYIGRKIANFIMRKCTRVYARDGLSAEYLKMNHITNNADEAIDVAFRLPYKKPDKQRNDGKTHVGINISGLLFNGGYTKNNQFGLTIDYAALTHQLLKQLTQRNDCVVHLVSHVIPESIEAAVEDDYAVCALLNKQYPTTHLINKFTSPSEAKSFISGMDFFIGARMHACIAAFSSGVPVIPLSYSRKFNGLFNSLGYTYLGDCKASTEAKLLELIMTSLDKRDELIQQITKGNDIAQRKLERYENLIAQTLKDCNDAKTFPI